MLLPFSVSANVYFFCSAAIVSFTLAVELCWISGNQVHLYALRTRFQHAIFIRQCTTFSWRTVNRHKNWMEAKREAKKEQKNYRTKLKIKSRDWRRRSRNWSAHTRRWNEIQKLKRKWERHERIITVIFIYYLESDREKECEQREHHHAHAVVCKEWTTTEKKITVWTLLVAVAIIIIVKCLPVNMIIVFVWLSVSL